MVHHYYYSYSESHSCMEIVVSSEETLSHFCSERTHAWNSCMHYSEQRINNNVQVHIFRTLYSEPYSSVEIVVFTVVYNSEETDLSHFKDHSCVHGIVACTIVSKGLITMCRCSHQLKMVHHYYYNYSESYSFEKLLYIYNCRF